MVVALGLIAGPAGAQNAAFQSFFGDLCTSGSPSGGLIVACNTNPNLSSDSQTSLNPSQAVSATDAALARAKERRSRGERLLEQERDEAAGQIGASAGEDMASADFGRLSLLLNGRYTWLDRQRNPASDSERGYEGDIYGVQFGGDYRISDQTVIGALLGYDRTETTFDRLATTTLVPPGDDGETEVDGYSINLFAAHNIDDNWFVDVNLGYTYNDYTFGRNGAFQDTGLTTTITGLNVGETEGAQWSGGAGVGYDHYSGPLTIGPYARFNIVHTSIDSYTETDLNGAGFAMRIDPDSRTSVTSVLGVRVSYAISTGFGVVVPQARAEYEHEFDNDAQVTGTSFVLDTSNTVLTVTGDSPDRNYFNLGAGVAMVLPNGWLPFVDYEALVGYEDFDRHRVTFGLRKEL